MKFYLANYTILGQKGKSEWEKTPAIRMSKNWNSHTPMLGI